MNNWAVFVAGLIFTLVAILHLYRLIYPFTVTFGAVSIPEWASVIGFVISGLMAAWLFYSLT